MEIKKIDRRDFIKVLGAGTIGTVGFSVFSNYSPVNALDLGSIPSHRIVEIRNSNASNWDYSTGNYFDYFDQQVIESMFNEGLCRLTQTNSPKEAWATVMSSYVPGDKISIKLNLNNYGKSDYGRIIDATAPVLNCIICGLVENLGVSVEDIWPFDSDKDLTIDSGVKQRIWDRLVYKYYYRPDPIWSSVYIDWSFSGGSTGTLSSYITNAQHHINLCLFKTHWMGVTASMKNHIGTKRYSGPHSCPGYDGDTGICNGPILADIYKSSHIKEKTRLIVGDCIFGTTGGSSGSVNRFVTCSNESPNALFFGIDPVAFDSVLWDYLNDETGVNAEHGFLDLAQNNPYNLGIHEHYHGDHEYNNIELIKIKPQPSVEKSDIDKMIKNQKNGLASARNVKALVYRYEMGV